MDFVRVYEILAQARERLFGWIRPLGQTQYTQPFPFGLRTLRATLVEIAQVEYFYGKRLREEPLPGSDDYPISEARQPTFADLERVWTALAQETRATLVGIADWNRAVTRRIEQPEKLILSTATKADIATQMLFHEVHHRAQAMAMLRQLGVEAQNLDYLTFAAKREEFPKGAAPHG
ncbi:MAG TPA: DinB family protein [bacterium]|nr:DinB family protein [bacterium]